MRRRKKIKHLKYFKNIVDIIEHPGGDIFADAARLVKNKKEKDIEDGVIGVIKEGCVRCVRKI